MVGVDEVGRGCWAGPLLVVAARTVGALPVGLKDSKLLSKIQREKLFIKLQKSCDFAEGWINAQEIDERGLAGSLRLGTARALVALKTDADEEVIIDGAVNYAPPAFVRVNCIVRADSLVPLVSAAGIYAKVKRDQCMAQLARVHPSYGFERHVGYGTKAHQLALKNFGALNNVHRLSFRPMSLANEATL